MARRVVVLTRAKLKKATLGTVFWREPGEEAVEAKGFLASFGDDDLIASEDVDIIRLKEM